jgi:actin-related protein
MSERTLKEELQELNRHLTLEEIFDLLCVPEATDDLEDIEFDEDIDEVIERGFIEGWIHEEMFREYNMNDARVTREMEVQYAGN